MPRTATFVVTIVNDSEDLKGRVHSIRSGEQTSFASREELLRLLDRMHAVERVESDDTSKNAATAAPRSRTRRPV